MGTLQRKPLAFGITKWGPLPGSESAYLLWDGPGAGLYFYAKDPEDPATGSGRRIMHPSANGTYQTVREAGAAVQAFVTAGLSKGDGNA